MSSVAWLPEALADVKRLHDLLNAKHPSTAARAARAISFWVRLLATS